MFSVGLEAPGSFQRSFDHCQWQQQGLWGIEEWHCAIALIPGCSPFVLCINQQGDSPDLSGGQQAAPTCSQQQLASKALALKFQVYGQPPQSEDWHVISSDAFLHWKLALHANPASSCALRQTPCRCQEPGVGGRGILQCVKHPEAVTLGQAQTLGTVNDLTRGIQGMPENKVGHVSVLDCHCAHQYCFVGGTDAQLESAFVFDSGTGHGYSIICKHSNCICREVECNCRI